MEEERNFAHFKRRVKRRVLKSLTGLLVGAFLVAFVIIVFVFDPTTSRLTNGRRLTSADLEEMDRLFLTAASKRLETLDTCPAVPIFTSETNNNENGQRILDSINTSQKKKTDAPVDGSASDDADNKAEAPDEELIILTLGDSITEGNNTLHPRRRAVEGNYPAELKENFIESGGWSDYVSEYLASLKGPTITTTGTVTETTAGSAETTATPTPAASATTVATSASPSPSAPTTTTTTTSTTAALPTAIASSSTAAPAGSEKRSFASSSTLASPNLPKRKVVIANFGVSAVTVTSDPVKLRSYRSVNAFSDAASFLGDATQAVPTLLPIDELVEKAMPYLVGYTPTAQEERNKSARVLAEDEMRGRQMRTNRLPKSVLSSQKPVRRTVVLLVMLGTNDAEQSNWVNASTFSLEQERFLDALLPYGNIPSLDSMMDFNTKALKRKTKANARSLGQVTESFNMSLIPARRSSVRLVINFITPPPALPIASELNSEAYLGKGFYNGGAIAGPVREMIAVAANSLIPDRVAQSAPAQKLVPATYSVHFYNLFDDFLRVAKVHHIMHTEERRRRDIANTIAEDEKLREEAKAREEDAANGFNDEEDAKKKKKKDAGSSSPVFLFPKASEVDFTPLAELQSGLQAHFDKAVSHWLQGEIQPNSFNPLFSNLTEHVQFMKQHFSTRSASEFLYDSVHPSRLGHSLISRLIYKFLTGTAVKSA